MATNFLHGAIGTVATLAQNDLNNLANGSSTGYQTEVDNRLGSTKALLWLHIDSQSNTYTALSHVKVVFVPSTTPNAASGTYPSITSGASYKLADGNYPYACIYVCPKAFSSAVADDTFPYADIPPGYFQPVIINNTGFALPATNSNTVKMYTTPLQF